jgi:hypothetical protein
MTPLNISGIENGWIVDGCVSRGAQPDDSAWPLLAAAGYQCVIDLNNSGSELEHQVSLIGATGMKLYADAWSGWKVPLQEQIDAALEQIVGRTFVHCKRGSDRTGTVCACRRIKFDRWSAAKAIEESLFGLGSHGLHEGWMEAAVWEFSRRVSGSSGIQ